MATQFIPTPDMTGETVTGYPDGRPAHWIAVRDGAVIGAYSHTIDSWTAHLPGTEHTCRSEQAARRWISRHTTGAELPQMAEVLA